MHGMIEMVMSNPEFIHDVTVFGAGFVLGLFFKIMADAPADVETDIAENAGEGDSPE